MKNVSGNRYAEVPARKVLIRGPWNVTFYGKGWQHQTFLDKGAFTSERIPMFKLWLCPVPFVPWMWGKLWSLELLEAGVACSAKASAV